MRDLKHLDINPYDWTAISTNGDSWYVAIHKEQDIDRKKYLEKLERRLSLWSTCQQGQTLAWTEQSKNSPTPSIPRLALVMSRCRHALLTIANGI